MVKNSIIITQAIVILFLAWKVFFAPHNDEEKKSVEAKKYAGNIDQTATIISDADLSIQLIESQENTWGYKILLHGSLFIVQSNIPGFPGNKGFETREMALKTGELVMEKIKNGQMPPTVSYYELKSLGVLK